MPRPPAWFLAALTGLALAMATVRAEPMAVLRVDGNALRTIVVGQPTPFADALLTTFQRLFWWLRREVCRFHREMLEGRHAMDLDFPTCPAGGVLSRGPSGSLICPYHDVMRESVLAAHDDADFRLLLQKLVQLQIFVHAPMSRPAVASAAIVVGTAAEYKNLLLGLDTTVTRLPRSLPVKLATIDHVLEITPVNHTTGAPLLDRNAVALLSRGDPAPPMPGAQPSPPLPLLRATFNLEPEMQRMLEMGLARLGQTASAPASIRLTLMNQKVHIELVFPDRDSAQTAERALGAGLGALEIARAFERQRPELELAALLLSGSHWVEGHSVVMDRRLPDTIPAPAAEALQAYIASREGGREGDSGCARACRRATRAVYAWQVERGSVPSKMDDLVEIGYLEEPVLCPMGGALSITAAGNVLCGIHSADRTR